MAREGEMHGIFDPPAKPSQDPALAEYGDHSSTYWPEGWNYQRYSTATAEDILALPEGELDKMQAGLREVLGEQGAAAMSKRNFDRRLSVGGAGADEGAEAALAATADDVRPSWLRQWEKRHRGQAWGLVAVRASCYGDGGEDKWRRFRAVFDQVVAVPFDWAVENTSSGDTVAEARSMFEVRWIEDPELDCDAGKLDVSKWRRKFAQLEPSLTQGLLRPLFLAATAEVVDSVLDVAENPPTITSQRGRHPAPWIYAVTATADCGVPEEHAESAWFREVFKVAVEVLADELWWIVDSDAMPLRRITRGVKGEGVASDSGNDELEDLWWSTAPPAERLKKITGSV